MYYRIVNVALTVRTIFTALIRRMTEGNVFTLSTIGGGGGVPPSFPMGRGTPILPDGGYPYPRSEWGYPHVTDREGYLHLADGGYPPVRAGWGYPLLGLDGGTPLVRRQEQHSEHLLRSRRYASYVDAGGLSCLYRYFTSLDYFVEHTSQHPFPIR